MKTRCRNGRVSCISDRTSPRAGLEVWIERGSLKMRGPKRLAALVKMIANHKAGVIAALESTLTDHPECLPARTSLNTVAVTETSQTPANDEVVPTG